VRILFNNVFENASLVATNESLNYPVENLVHPFLRKRFQSTNSTSLITATFTEDQIMDCFFYGWHNMTSVVVVFKDSGAGTLLTLNITSPEDVGAEIFTQLITVRSVEITASGASGFYLGGIGSGACYQMPDPLANYDPGFTDNSNFVESPDGQTLQTYIEPLDDFNFGFRDETLTIRSEVMAKYKAVGKGKPIYFNFYEDNREKEPPLYGKIINPLRSPYSPRRYNFTLEIREAR
jgi:hypothetical protein